MKRRSRAGGKPIKTRRGKTVRSKRGNAPKTERGRNPSIADLREQLDRRTRERDEALARQAATADILRIISQSPTEVRPVFDSIVFTALRLLHCDVAVLLLCDGTTITHAAAASPGGPYADLPMPFPLDPGVNFPSRAIVNKTMLHLPDWSLIDPPEFELKMQKMWDVKSSLYLPLLREGNCIGVLGLAGPRPNTFGAAEIAQAEAFRDQAVIAIENARLLNELRQRTADLAESLEQQTATADVLKVISTSRGSLEPVFSTLLRKATQLCDAHYGNMWLCEADAFRSVALHGELPAAFAEHWGTGAWLRPGPDVPIARAVKEKRPIQLADVLRSRPYIDRHPLAIAAVHDAGILAILAVPLLKDNDAVGAIAIYSKEARPFTDKQIALVQNFAAQAVIAIENARLLTELRESLQQQTATADVLKVISRSTFDLQTVLDTLVESAARLCNSEMANIARPELEGFFQVAATYGASVAHGQVQKRLRFRPERGTLIGRVLLEGAPVHIEDAEADPEYTWSEARKLGGFRTMLGVPLMREGVPIGVFGVVRTSVRPYTDKEIELLTTLADQAVIAIENARLFEAEQQRTRELTESLEQQTATAEVLRVISSSPGDLQPVFASMLENAVRICDAQFGNIYRWDGDALHLAAAHNIPPAFAEFRGRTPLRPNPKLAMGRMVATKAAVHVVDNAAEQAYIEREPSIVAAVELGGVRTYVAVPMLKGSELIGAVTVYRQEVRPFTDKQMELVQNFAAQAVIAIENTRLLTELRRRTDDLTESLEQQTATSEVLQVISSSPGDLQPVFETMLDNAVRICEAKFGNIYRWDGEALHLVASHNTPAAFAEQRRREPFRPSPKNSVGQMIATKTVVHIPDVVASEAYIEREPVTVAGVEIASIRTFLAVPMLKENELVGAFALARQEVRPFTEKQVELVQNFAAQAVIAIENTRLLTELRRRTDELAQRQAELSVTFDNMGDGVVMFNEEMRLAAWNKNLQEILDLPDSFFAEPRTYRDYMTYLIERGEFGNVDLEAELQRYIESTDRERRVERTRPDGRVLEVRVNPVPGGGFVAIYSDVTERKNGEERVRAARDAAESALRELKAAQDRLVQTEKLASLGQLTAGIAHEIKNPLNFVNNFSAVSVELIDELRETLVGVSLDDKLRKEINEIADMLQSNLDKVVQHGKRADSIVKNMLLHSRQGSGEHRPVDINALVEESLNLAYHGARAEKQGFNITLERSFDPVAGEVGLFPQEITRVLLNLISNGFYAATKRKAEANGNDYEPTLAVSTKNLGDRVEIRIRDNGTGIPPEVKEKIFNPFFTTKPAGEGTGLGLSLSHDIVVKQHSGTIDVDTRPGEFTEFRIVLPRHAAAISKLP